MRKRILICSSYEETLQNLKEYHEKFTREVWQRFKLPSPSVNPFLALRKNVEIGFLYSPLASWEQDAVSRYGKKPVLEEYYPLIFDFVERQIIPQKIKDYGCDIPYFYIFRPVRTKDSIYSFFVNFFEKPIFKKFNAGQSVLEQEIVAMVSAFFRTQNKYGPEQISVAIFGDHFITIMVSGLMTPFLREFIRDSESDAAVVGKIFRTQAKELLAQIFSTCFSSGGQKPFIYFDQQQDKMIILAELSEKIWEESLFQQKI